MSAFSGTAALLRANLRHDGRRMAPWITIVTALSISSPIAYSLIFPSAQERASFASLVESNPAMGLIFGPAYNLRTDDGFNTWRALAIGGFLAALCAIFTVVRATRRQEDSGQAELLASGVLGRNARLASGVLMSLMGTSLMGIVAWGLTVVCGGGSAHTALLCATFTATGWMFTAIAACAVQLSADSHGATSLSVSFLGVLFALRGFAFSLDAPQWTIWANPLGWMTLTKSAYEDTWLPLVPAVCLTVVFVALAFAFQSRRDFAQGLIVPGPGPREGKIRGPLGLALRLNRASIASWIVAALALGAVFGYFTTSVGDIFASNPAIQSFLAAGATSQDALISSFVVTALTIIGIICAVPGVLTMAKVREEEMSDRVEPVIAAGVARGRYYFANAVVALATSASALVCAAAVMGAVAGSAGTGIASAVGRSLAIIPAVWMVVAISIAVVGLRPQVIIASWVGVLASFGLTMFGPSFKLPGWALGISPFYHAPNVTLDSPSLVGIGAVSILAILAVTAGHAGFSRRDLAV